MLALGGTQTGEGEGGGEGGGDACASAVSSLAATSRAHAQRSPLPAPLAQGGGVEGVTVYPSDYGLQRMAQEAALGPLGVFGSGGGDEGEGGEEGEQGGEEGEKGGEEGEEGGEEQGEEEGDEGEEGEEDDDEGQAAGSSGEEGGGGGVDQRRLRLYERSKLRYYYAVVECDSGGWVLGGCGLLNWLAAWAMRGSARVCSFA